MLHRQSTVSPQAVHVMIAKIVNKLCIEFLLLRCNNSFRLFDGLRFFGFLPTMNFQLSQLPMIVGSGRVKIRRALFSFYFVLIQSLKYPR
jgi:hypothetical protein